jgi:hypothetical protein
MTPDEEKTVVIFRKFRDGDVIAIFPTLPGTNDESTCTNYMHMGQHGTCDPIGLTQTTKPATLEEYRELERELRGIGYNLDIIQRQRSAHRNTRRREIGRV